MSEADAPRRSGTEVGVVQIKKLIPHRYPFLLVDRIVDMHSDKRAVGIKNVTINEPFFQGHFPDAPVMPGVLIVEAMAQTAGALVVQTLGIEYQERLLVYFMSIDNCRFRRPVVPGDQLMIEVVKERSRGPVWKFRGIARVEGKVVAEAVFAAMVRDKE